METLADILKQAAAEAGKYDSCMSLSVSEEGRAVTLNLDSSVDSVSEWIPGEGADIALMRCRDSGRVVGVRLPLMCDRLSVWHEGPLRVNAGFRKDDQP